MESNWLESLLKTQILWKSKRHILLEMLWDSKSVVPCRGNSMETLLVHQKATSSLIDSWETSTVTVLCPSKYMRTYHKLWDVASGILWESGISLLCLMTVPQDVFLSRKLCQVAESFLPKLSAELSSKDDVSYKALFCHTQHHGFCYLSMKVHEGPWSDTEKVDVHGKILWRSPLLAKTPHASHHGNFAHRGRLSEKKPIRAPAHR